jgi:peroxiredoxin
MRGWVMTGLLAVGLLGGGCDLGSGESASDPSAPAGAEPVQERYGLTVGSPAADFQLWDLYGNPVTLSRLRGRVVLINFWATWCGPCRVEMPGMESLYRQFERKDFEILAVSTDQQGAAVTKPFKDQLGLTFPILHDSDYRVGLVYGARTLPMTFLVDRRGIITHRIFGARDWQTPEGRKLIQTLVQAP